MKYWNYWILFILVSVFSIYFITTSVEKFEDHYPGYNVTLKYANDSSNIMDRHPIHDSLVQNLNFKYKKAYNYELENKEYEQALIQTFQLGQTCLMKTDYTEPQPLNRTLDPSIQNAYEQAIQTIQGSLKESKFFNLPDGLSQTINPIQMVHDKLISYQLHKTIPNHYLLYIDVILYREAKYHGKHISFIVLVEKNKQWTIKVLDAKVKGIVFEDKIALYPVQGNDAYQTNQDLSTF